MPKSSTAQAAGKPQKPRPDFPLFPHGNGQWAKKVRGRLHYFGPWDDPEGALARWLKDRDYLVSGRTPPAAAEGLTLRELANRFLTRKQQAVEAGELSDRTFQDYKAALGRLLKALGKDRLVGELRPEDLAVARAAASRRSKSPIIVQNELQRYRTLFKFAWDDGLIDTPVRVGTALASPKRAVVRRHKAGKPAPTLTAEQIHKLLAVADAPARAMLLLGINCGLGNTDVAELERRHLDLDAGVLGFPRGKTGIHRRAVLWPETVEALRLAIDARPDPADKAHDKRVFLTARGLPLVRMAPKGWRDDVVRLFGDLTAAAGIQTAGGYYSLRHTFRTVADGVADRGAIDLTMGHLPAMADVGRTHYVHAIDDARLGVVADHVHRWLFAEVGGEGEGKGVGAGKAGQTGRKG